MKRSDEEGDKAHNLREGIHSKARKQKDQSIKKKAQGNVAFSDLVKRLQNSYITIEPQHIEFLKNVLFEQESNVALDSKINDLSILNDINPKENITSLNQNNNQKIEQLNVNFSIFPRLSTIVFKEGKIKTLTGLIIEKTRLEEIDLSDNQISNIPKLPRFPYKLRSLSLSGNQIASLQFLKSADLRNLTRLYLQKNQISSLLPLVDLDFRYLTELHLSNNLITNLNGIGQIEFKNLKKLALNNNKINSIDEIYKISISLFNWIELSHNEITDFTPLLKMEVKDLVYVYNIYVEDAFPGIYIEQNNVKKQELTKIFKNNEKIKCIVDELDEEDWEVLYEKFGRYDNYGEDEANIEKLIKQKEVNSVQGSQSEEAEEVEDENKEQENAQGEGEEEGGAER